MSTYLETIEKLHPDIVHHFLTTGESKGIPPEVQEFLKQIQWAAEIYEYERNITRAARKLQIRVLATQGINLDQRTCKARFYSAIAYFNVDNNVSVKVWASDYADKYEDLAKLAIASDELRTAKACLDAAKVSIHAPVKVRQRCHLQYDAQEKKRRKQELLALKSIL